jgi:hypothetical protein
MYTGILEFMARTQTPDGKRVTICIKVSEPEAAAIDAARGALTRSAWGRGAMLAHAPDPVPPVRPERPARAAKLATASPAPVAADSAPAPCPHAYPDVKTIMGQRVCRKCD